MLRKLNCGFNVENTMLTNAEKCGYRNMCLPIKAISKLEGQYGQQLEIRY